MDNGQLPKSLHTVRILVAVAARITDSNTRSSPVNAILAAANVCGYPSASASDPLILKAAAILAKSSRPALTAAA